jgi:hypothetical protein
LQTDLENLKKEKEDEKALKELKAKAAQSTPEVPASRRAAKNDLLQQLVSLLVRSF